MSANSQIPNLFWPVANLSILLGVLTYYLRTPLKSFVRARHEGLKADIDGASRRLAAAVKLSNEIQSTSARVDAELADMRDAHRREVEQTVSQVTQNAKAVADQIRSDAKDATAGLAIRLKDELILALGQEVLERAESVVRSQLSSDQKQQLKRKFSAELGSGL